MLVPLPSSTFAADPDGALPPGPRGSRWRAELELRFEQRRGRTVLASRRQQGPLLVQRPFHPEGDRVCHTYVLHPPAGIVGGDHLSLKVEVASGAHALITTPGATRWYFSRGITANSLQVARIEDEGVLEWLPQETLVFDGAHVQTKTRIALAGGARFLGWEILGLGRPACGEVYASGRIDSAFEIDRDGIPLVRERLRAGSGGIAGLHGHAAYATLIATGADAEALARARSIAASVGDALCGATLIGDVLLVRGLADFCEPLVRAFSRIWSELRPGLLGRDAAAPRIWRT